MRSLRVLASLIVLISFQSYSQQLIINEVSQGNGSAEYVELLVMGTLSCQQTTTPCIDIRGYVIDDNNGYFASGSGTGIASGALRFANNPFWSCIPQGTLIVVYNEADRNSAIPPDDVSITDGNCRLILPASSNLLEGQNTSPTASNSSYPGAGTWVLGGGSWNSVSMNNTNDSFLVTPGITTTTPLNAVSWGNNTNNTIIYFAGSAGGKVFSMTNNTSNNPTLQANWSSGDVGVDETPGAPNNAANSAWIGSMNPQCGVVTPLQVTATPTPSGCGGSCSGAVNTTVTGGTAPYTYSWLGGETTANLSGMCAGTYTVTVTDAGGCTMDAQATVTNTGSTLSVQATSTNETCAGACDGTAAATVNGGTAPFTISWSSGPTTANISNLCPDVYTVQVTDQSGCTGSAQVTIADGATVVVAITSASETCAGACDGGLTGSASGGTGPYSFLWDDNTTFANISNQCPGTYSVTVTDQNGCTATNSGTVSAGVTNPDATIQTTGPFTTSDAPIQFTAVTPGGTWTADCGACITTSGVFTPQSAGAGTYQICYAVGAGACADQDCQTIVVTGCSTQTTSEAHSICPGQAFTFNNQTFTDAGAYPFTFTGQNGCDSTHTLNLSVFDVFPQTQDYTRCFGDSVLVDNTWYFSPDTVITNIVDQNGCPNTHTSLIYFEDCTVEDYEVFIPNIFTPNNDNVNDFFAINILGGYLSEGFILNRWGNVIKEFHADDLIWDGKTTEGSLVQDGVYTYIFIVSNNQGAKTKYNGFVTMIR